MYYILTAYIVGDNFPTIITLSGVDYYMPRLMASSISVYPAFSFGVTPLGTWGASYTVYSPGSSSIDPIERRQYLLDNMSVRGSYGVALANPKVMEYIKMRCDMGCHGNP